MPYQQNIGLVIVAAGRGERAGLEDGPKQYRRLGHSTVMAETLKCFGSLIAPENTFIVIHQDDQELFETATKDVDVQKMHLVTGGQTRQESVRAGLNAMAAATQALTHVMIHDAARPFVSEHLLFEILETAGAYPTQGILPTIAISETLKTVDNEMVTGTASRDNMHRAQTPQTFPLNAIVDAHNKAASESERGFTDDAAIFEWMGLPVRIIQGEVANIKLTYRQDFPEDQAMQKLPDIRTGNGYDVHRFRQGDAVTLCGVDIPFDKALDGHSDADVGLHALTDALLATCGAGDIGDHFPPSDPQWQDKPSHIFLAHAAQLVADKGGIIKNVDITLVAEAPKIAPHRLAMRQRLSQLLAIELDRCSVKATTNEKMGFVGRQEGIMALATASVAYGEIDD